MQTTDHHYPRSRRRTRSDSGAPAQPLTTAFGRKLRRMLLYWVAAVLAAGTVIGWRTLDQRDRTNLLEQARLCAAALIPEADGDLTRSVHRIQGGAPHLIAVATIDGSNQIESVYPDHPAYRNAAASLLNQDAEIATMIAPSTGESIHVAGLRLPLNGTNSPLSQQAIFLFREPGRGWALGPAIGFFVAATLIAGACAAKRLQRWLEEEVATPLRTIATRLNGAVLGNDRHVDMVPGVIGEAVDIAESAGWLLRRTGEAEARARRIQRAADHHLKTRERGFHTQLRRMMNQANTDPLTKLRNRSYLEEQLDSLFERHSRSPADLTAVMIDVDNFKQYNDTRGHQFGDALLRFVGALLRGTVRPADLAVRYGGDEFLLLLPETGAEQACVIAERLVRLFSQYIVRLGKGHNLSISAGVASIRGDDPKDGPALIAKADVALYTAKRNGKNNVALCSPA